MTGWHWVWRCPSCSKDIPPPIPTPRRCKDCGGVIVRHKETLRNGSAAADAG